MNVKIIDGKFKAFDQIDKAIIRGYCEEYDKYLVQIDKYNLVYIERNFLQEKEIKTTNMENKLGNKDTSLTIKFHKNLIYIYWNDILIRSQNISDVNK